MPGEFDLIARYLRPLAKGEPAALDLSDDAAVLTPPPGRDLVLAADAMVEGVHFLPDDPAELIGRKLLRVNLSDLAAMGARPLGYLMTLALPSALDEAWLAAFTEGLAADQEIFGLQVLGGDITRTEGPLALSLTILGAVPSGRRLTRGGARVGDLVYVSGTIGDAGLGLTLLQERLKLDDSDARNALVARYQLPTPRLALGQTLLADGLASAAIDVSDGLIADAGHIAETSGCRLEIEARQVPRSADASSLLAAAPEWNLDRLAAGDDYELLFCAPASAERRLAVLAGELSLSLTVIGSVRAGEGATLLDESGRELDLGRAGWTHF